MKRLRPATLVLLGPVLLGLAIAVAVWLVMPDSRNLPSLSWALAIGAIAGLAIFVPSAAILAIAQRRPGWLMNHSWRLHFYSSVAMAASLGYLAACLRYRISDKLMLAAFGIVFLGAVIKTALSCALREERSVRSSG